MKKIKDIKNSGMLKATKKLVKEVLNFPYFIFSDDAKIEITKFPFIGVEAKIDFSKKNLEFNIYKESFNEKACEISKLYKTRFNDNMEINNFYED